MNPKQTILISAGLLLLIGLVFSGSNYLANKTISGVANDGQNNSLIKNPIQWISQKVSQSGAVPQVPTLPTQELSGINLSDVVSLSIFSKLSKIDSTTNLNSKSNINELQKAITESVGDGKDVFTFSIKDENILVSKDNSEKAKIEYLKKVESTITKSGVLNLYKASVTKLEEDFQNDCFIGEGNSYNTQLSNKFAELAAGLLKISVPSDLVEFHKKIISVIGNQKLIYEGIAKCFSDPIKGLLAINAMKDSPTKISELFSLWNIEAKKVGLVSN